MENNRKLQSHFGISSKNQNSICHRIRTKEHSIIKTRNISKQERSRLRTNGSGEKVEKRMHSKFFYRIEQNLPLTIFTEISMFDV